MKPRDWYGLIVRLAGLGSLITGVFDGIYAIASMLGVPLQTTYPTLLIEVSAVVWFVLGAILTLAADLLARLVYASEKSN